MTGAIEAFIGNTPLLQLKTDPGSARIFAKLESFNPGGSVKDRVALAMIEDAASRGLIRPETVLLEATSGNTGIGLSLVAAARGIPLVLVMPDSMSPERRKLLEAYGAQLILTPGALGMQGAIARVEQVLATDGNYLHLNQFANPVNPRVHYQTTGPEIFRSLGKRIDCFVAGVGSGGTLTGTGGFLKSRLPGLKIIAVEPAQSPVLAGGKPGPHPLQGLGAGFIPPVLDLKLIDEIIAVEGDAAMEAARELARSQGVLAGISAGAQVWAAKKAARQLDPCGVVVTILPDSGERYLSTDLFGWREAPQ